MIAVAVSKVFAGEPRMATKAAGRYARKAAREYSAFVKGAVSIAEDSIAEDSPFRASAAIIWFADRMPSAAVSVVMRVSMEWGRECGEVET